MTLKKSWVCLAGVLSMGLYVVAESAPNFIIFYVDDLGWADTSVEMMDGDSESKSDFHQTPHLEKLAARGMKFSNAYAPAPTCTPSRKSIQLGKTPGRLQYSFVNDVLALKRGLKWGGNTSMADVLKAAGKNYITAHFGKGMENEFMKELGYDVTDEYDIGPNGNFHGEYTDIKSHKPLPEDDPKRVYSLTDRSVEFVTKHAGKRPFFMMVSHYSVHVPHAATSRLIEKYRNLPRGKYCRDDDYMNPAEMSKGKRTCSWRLMYAAMIEEIDMSLGKIVEAVEQAGQLDNTYIIFTSDNGGGMHPNGSLRGGKATLYEGGLRVPWVMSGPGVPGGVQCDVPVNQWDLLPTLHDLAGSTEPLPEDLDGGSLRSVFEKGNEGAVERPVDGMVFHYPCYYAPPLSILRLGDYKYMRHLRTGEVRLYDMKNDYSETKNLVDYMPKKAAEMAQVLDQYLAAIDAEDVEEVYEARFWQLEQFETQSIQNFERNSRGLDKTRDAQKIARLKERLEKNKERFENERRKAEEWKQKTDW